MESQAVEQLTSDIENPSTETENTPVVGVAGDAIKKQGVLGNDSLELQDNIDTNNTELIDIIQNQAIQDLAQAILPQNKNLKEEGCWMENGQMVCPPG